MYTERERCVYMHFDYHNICVYIYIYSNYSLDISNIHFARRARRSARSSDGCYHYFYHYRIYIQIYIYIYICCLLIALVNFKWNVEELGVRRGPQTRAII